MEDNPPTAVSIDHFETVGAMFYVHMTDLSVKGPYYLPVVRWRPRGEWLPNNNYLQFDIVTNGGRTYVVYYPHTSGTIFDPSVLSPTGSAYYSLLFKNPDPTFDLALYFPGRIGAAGAVLMQHSIVRPVTLAAGLAESVAYLRVAASENLSLLIYHNATVVGTIDFIGSLGLDSDGGQEGSFTLPADVILAAGDRLSIVEPVGVEDTTAMGFSMTLVATVD